MMDYINATNEVYTWNQLTRPSWGPLEFITRGSMIEEIPHFIDGEMHGSEMKEYSGVICHKDMDTRQPYIPSEEDKDAKDWIYWFHPESRE